MVNVVIGQAFQLCARIDGKPVLKLLTLLDALQQAAKMSEHKSCAVIRPLVHMALSFDSLAPSMTRG